MKRITTELSQRDKKFGALIARRPLCPIGRTLTSQSHFEALVGSVISQQLAVKAAESIHARLVLLSKRTVTPKKIFALDEDALRGIGISGAKVKTIKGLAEAELTKKIPINRIHEIKNDDEIFEKLTSLWGIGPWTVDMFMIFQLGRLDIWPIGDLGVRRGWELTYKLTEEIDPKVMLLKGEKFRPYRSVIAWYCWQAIHEARDNKK